MTDPIRDEAGVRRLQDLLRKASSPDPGMDVPADRRLGPYRLFEELGRGGMGSVWKAWDTKLHRWVAVKRLVRAADDEGRRRFLREAQAAAGLCHPNLVTVHEVGEDGAGPYLVMELVEGSRIDLGATIRTVVEALCRVASALHEAHRQGVIHRDIKPANILIDSRGEPKVVDFGLASLQAVQEKLTATGEVMGTPAYMAPEQASGTRERIGPRTDVYGLGTILFEAMAGHPPFRGVTPLATLDQVLRGEPRWPQGSGDLVVICRKAMEKDPRHRYATAADLAIDLRRWLDGEPVFARPPSVVRRLTGIVRRRAVAIALAAAGVAVVGVALWAWVTGGKARVEAEVFRILEEVRPALDQARRYSYADDADYENLKAKVSGIQARLDDAAARAPHLAAPLDLQGRAWEILGWGERAEGCWRRAIALDPDFSPALFDLGRHLFYQAHADCTGRNAQEWESGHLRNQPRFEEAARLLDRSTKVGLAPQGPLYRDLAAAMSILARSAPVEFARRIDDALRTYDAAEEGYEEFLMLRVLTKGMGQRIGLYDEVLRRRPGHPLAHYFRGAERGLGGDLEGAVADFTRCLRTNPRFVPALVQRGECRSDAAAAIEDFDAALAIDPRFEAALLGRARRRIQTRAYSEAEEDIRKALALSPSARAHHFRGLIRSEAGRPLDAIESYAEALRLEPEDVLSLTRRGETLLALGRLKEAMEDFGAAIRVDPTAAEAYFGRGFCRQKNGDLSDAVIDYSDAIRCGGTRTKALACRGACLALLGRPDEAVRDLAQAVAMDPTNAVTRFNLGASRLNLRDAAGALTDFSEAIRLDPRLATAYTNRGFARRALNDLEGALQDFGEALALDPEDYAARYQRAVLLKSRGLLKEALDDFERVLRSGPESWPMRPRVEEEIRRLRGGQ